MPVTKSVEKSVRSANRKRVHNLRNIRAMNASIKDAIKNGTKESTVLAQKMIDKAQKRGVLKKGNASRKKSSLMRKK